MMSDRAFMALRQENVALRERVALLSQRLTELEARRGVKSGTRSMARRMSSTTPITISLEIKRRPPVRSRPRSQSQSVIALQPLDACQKRLEYQRRDETPAYATKEPARVTSMVLAPSVSANSHHAGVLGRAASNTIMLLSGQLVTWASTLILAAAYGRFLGAQGFGQLYLATTFTALVGFPIEFSFNQQIVRDVAQNPRSAHRYVTMALALKGILWIALYGLAMLLAVTLGYSAEQRWLIAICGLMLVSSAISSTLISIQTAYMQVGLAKFGVVIEKFLDMALAVLLLRAGAGVRTVALVLLLGSFVGMLWQILRVARIIGIRFTWDTETGRALIRSGVAFLAYGVLGVIYYRVDTVMLSVLGNEAAVGVYGAAYRILDTLMFVPGIVISAVVSPIMSKYSVGGNGKLRLTVEKSTLAMLLCAMPATVGLFVAAPNIIGFIYHRHDFVGSEAVLQALAVGLIPLYLNTVLTTVLVSTGQERKLPLMATAALVFNVALNWVLIPRFMGVGSAWATALTEMLLLGIGVTLLDRSLIPIRLWQAAAKIALASAVMGVFAYALASFTIVVIIPVAIVVYAAATLAFRVLPQEDLLQLRGVLARFGRRLWRRPSGKRALPVEVHDLALASASTDLEAAS